MSRPVFGTPEYVQEHYVNAIPFDEQFLFSYELPPEIRYKYRQDSTGTFIPKGGVGENILIYPFTKELSNYYKYN
jgi:hypothetical protein